MQQQTAERSLDMGAGAAKTIVQIEVAKRGIQIVAPEQADHPPAEPDTFRIALRTTQRLLGFGKLIDLLRLLVGGRGLVGRLGIIALGESSRSKDRSRSTHYDRYAEHTVDHGSLKFFMADSDDERGVSW